MATQPRLFSLLTCGNGAPWTSTGCGPCAGCQAEAKELQRTFAEKVQSGHYEDRGYTPKDRRGRRDVAA